MFPMCAHMHAWSAQENEVAMFLAVKPHQDFKADCAVHCVHAGLERAAERGGHLLVIWTNQDYKADYPTTITSHDVCMQAWSAQQNEVAIFLVIGPNKVSKGQELWLDYGAVGFPCHSFDVDLDGTYGIVVQPCCNACSVCLSYIVCRVLTAR